MKNPILAFVLALFPGGGLMYLGRLRGFAYTLGVIGSPIFFYILYQMSYYDVFIFTGIGVTFLLYLINFIDTGFSASKVHQKQLEELDEVNSQTKSLESERFYTIILSFIPGVGHLQLGLMNRGITLLITFFGLTSMIFFVTFLLGVGQFLIFSFILPVIWLFSFFDVMKQLERKQKGEELVDRSILEEFELNREDGKKSRSIAKILAIFPGAGHLYLGFQKRGIQLMALFLLSIYILDFLRLGLFLYLIPIIWFYSFFDGLQKASKYSEEPIKDEPILEYFMNHRKWVGIALIFVGLYYLADQILLPELAPYLDKWLQINVFDYFHRYFQIAVVSILFIVGGFKLMASSKKKVDGQSVK